MKIFVIACFPYAPNGNSKKLRFVAREVKAQLECLVSIMEVDLNIKKNVPYLHGFSVVIDSVNP